MSNPFDFFESLKMDQIIDQIFHSDESQKKEPKIEKIEGKEVVQTKRTFKGKNRGVSSTKLSMYVKELIECLRPTQTDSITLDITQLKSFLQPYFPECYKESLNRRIYDVVSILKAADCISGVKRQIKINRKDNFEDLQGVSFTGKKYDEKRVDTIVRLMSIEDPNIADILKPMNQFQKVRVEMPPTKSAKERFDDFMLVQDLSYLVDKPQKKT